MASLPSQKTEDSFFKEWELLWKKFSEEVSFLYDNEGVIESLQRKYGREDDCAMKKALEGQMDEVHHLVLHHREKLLRLVEKMQQLANEGKKDIGKAPDDLKKAIHSLNIDAIKISSQMFKKRCERGDSNP